MSQIVELPWGTGSLKSRLPETWSVLGELRPRSQQAASNPDLRVNAYLIFLYDYSLKEAEEVGEGG